MSQANLNHKPRPLEAATRPTGRDALLFSLRAAVAAGLSFVCYRATHLPGLSWAPVSAVLVMEPTLRPSLQASLVRFAANVTGAVCGMAVSVSLGPTPFAIVAGVLATGTVCHYARLDDGRRPAYVAMMIVLLNTGGGSVINESADRLAAVVTGCLVALLVSFAFELGINKLPAKTTTPTATAGE